MQNLTDRSKEVLTKLVELIRNGTIEDEFHLMWSMEGPVILTSPGFVQVPKVTKMSLDSLAQLSLIECQISKEDEVYEIISGRERHRSMETGRTCTVTPKGFRAVETNFAAITPTQFVTPPSEIAESLDLFREDHPDPSKVAFIMMRFGRTSAHERITSAIKASLKEHGIIALRADDKQYNDDLFPNILTYIFGCRFGIAVFERIEAEDFNPNVSLELGFMMGLKKHVCLLKDKTLKTLHTDLVGKLYRVFDPLNPEEDIQKEVSSWLSDKKLSTQPGPSIKNRL